MHLTIDLESDDQVTINSRIRPHTVELRDTEWWIFLPTADQQKDWPERELHGGPGTKAEEFDPLEWAKPVLKAMSPGTSLLERLTVILRGQHHALDQMNYNTTNRPNFIDTYHEGKCDTCDILKEAVSYNEPRY